MILAYHNIADNPDDFWAVHPDKFAADMRYLHEQGVHCYNLTTYMDNPSTWQDVCLTFDDGYRDFLETAMPILDQYDFGCSLFVPVSHVGGVSDWRRKSLQAPLMEWADIRTALECPRHEIGSHGVRHRKMINLSRTELNNELLGSMEQIEDRVGVPVRALSYPWCTYDDKVVSAVEKIGYLYAVAGGNGNDDPLTLHRQGMHRDTDITEVMACG